MNKQTNAYRVRKKFIALNLTSTVACNAPYVFCCKSGVLGDQECQDLCIKESKINDGNKDCDNGSDEEVIGIFCKFL